MHETLLHTKQLENDALQLRALIKSIGIDTSVPGLSFVK